MKFIISRTTVEAVLNAANEVGAVSGGTTDYVVPSNESINADDKLANVSIRGEQTDIVVEINDEIVLRYLALYIKTAKLVAPLVTAAIGMWNAVQGLIKTDCEELVAFALKRKE